jgi:hypothetical protein
MAGADQPVPPLLDHQRRDRWDLNHLMPQWLWIISLEQGAAATARLRVMLDDLVNPLNRQQLRPGSWMARLCSATMKLAGALHH